LLAGFVFLQCLSALADEPSNLVAFDSVDVLVSGSSGDESTAIPIFLTDIEFEARLLLVKKHGSKWNENPIDSALFFNARRKVTLVSVLAHVARLIGKEPSVVEINALVKEVTDLAGGKKPMQELLNMSGMTDEDLITWAARAILAEIQLQYLAERIEPPTEKELLELFNAGGHSFEGRVFAEVKIKFRQEIMKNRLVRAIGEWLQAILEHGQIRFTV